MTRIIWVALAFPLLMATLWQGTSGQRCSKNTEADGKDATVAKKNSVPTGKWGGQHIGLLVTDEGARLNYDCAHGTIDQPMKLDDDARFDVTGVHVRERGGPVRRGDQPARHPARYTGHLDGNTMTLTVTLTDTNQEVGTFTLSYDTEPKIFKCL